VSNETFVCPTVAVKAVKSENQYGVPQILRSIIRCFKSCLVFPHFQGAERV